MRLSQVFAETMGAVRSNIEAARASLSRIGPIPGGPTSIAISKLDAALTTLDRDYVPPAAPAPLAPNELQELLGRTVLDGVRAAGIPLASWEDLPANTREGLWRAGRAAWEDGWQYGYSELRVAMGAPGETPDAPAGRAPARRDIGDTFAGVWLALTHARIQAHAGAPASTMLAALETIELRLSALDHRMAPVLDAVDQFKAAGLRGEATEEHARDILRALGAYRSPTPDEERRIEEFVRAVDRLLAEITKPSAWEAPCETDGQACDWTSEEFVGDDEDPADAPWDMFCAKCGRWRDWSRDALSTPLGADR